MRLFMASTGWMRYKACEMQKLWTPILASAALTAAPALAQSSGGAIGTLPTGTYRCELPGDAAGRAGVRQPERDFAVTGSSTYTAGGAGGTYLMRGNRVQMTSGPMQGSRFAVMGSGFLKEIDANGTPGRLRCVRR